MRIKPIVFTMLIRGQSHLRLFSLPVPPGIRIGWVTGSDVFLEPEASYQVAQELAGADRLVGEQTLRHRPRERGLLASIDEGRKMVQVRRTLEGSSRQVLHLKASVLRTPLVQADVMRKMRSWN
jgi:hypothetical protein